MGLKSDLKKAFLQSSGAEEYGEGNEGNVDKLAEGISTAIDNYIKNKKFNITSLDADIKIRYERLKKRNENKDDKTNIKETIKDKIKESIGGSIPNINIGNGYQY